MRDSDEENISNLDLGQSIFLKFGWFSLKSTKPILVCHFYEQIFGSISSVVQFHPEGNPG